MAGAGAARPADDRERLVPRSVAVIGAWSWRLVAAGLVGWALLGLLDRLRVVVFPVVVAGILTVPLATVADGLRRRGVPPAASAALVLAGFLAAGAGAAMLIVPPVAREFDDLGPAVEEAYEDLEAWLVDDAPVEISRERLDELEEQGEDAIRSALSGSGGLVVRSAVLVVEIVAGLVLSLVLTFFMVKDGPRFQAFALGFVPEDRQQLVRRMAARAWTTLGGYLRGSALLGTLEAAVIGITLVLLGADLVVPVMVVTFLAAFVPFLGAIVAGILAVAVALATVGPGAAGLVAVVALVVQQLDNDLLAPYVFGKALRLHPVVILLAVAAGGALAGLAGAFLAVPATAVVLNVADEARGTARGGEALTPRS